MTLNRRGFIQAGAVSVTVGSTLVGCAARISAAGDDSRAPSHPPVLDEASAATADALADTLVPGAAAAGFSRYLDEQLACPPEQSLLIGRYLGIEPPYRNFYLPALRASDAWARVRYGKDAAQLDAADRELLMKDLAAGTAQPWDGAPSPFVHFVLRADAIDVVYGTRKGFARLGIPYMAHIEPERDW